MFFKEHLQILEDDRDPSPAPQKVLKSCLFAGAGFGISEKVSDHSGSQFRWADVPMNRWPDLVRPHLQQRNRTDAWDAPADWRVPREWSGGRLLRAGLSRDIPIPAGCGKIVPPGVARRCRARAGVW